MNFVQRNASNLHELTEASTDCKPKVSRRGLAAENPRGGVLSQIL